MHSFSRTYFLQEFYRSLYITHNSIRQVVTRPFAQKKALFLLDFPQFFIVLIFYHCLLKRDKKSVSSSQCSANRNVGAAGRGFVYPLQQNNTKKYEHT